MSDTSGTPLTDWAAAPVGANRRPSSAARSSTAPRNPHSDVRRHGPLHVDVRGHAWTVAADVPPRGRRADTSRGAVGQPRPNPHPGLRGRQSGHRRVRRLAAPDRVGVNRHGSVIRFSRGPGGPYTTSCRGWPWSCGRVRWQHERDPFRLSESRSAVPARPSSRSQARGPMSSPPSCSSRSIDPLKPYPARLDRCLRQGGSVPVLQIPDPSVGLGDDLWSYDTEYPPVTPAGTRDPLALARESRFSGVPGNPG